MSRTVWAIRGAITIPADTAEEVATGVRELLAEIFTRNELVADDIISIVFTTTEDVSSMFPATAARAMGLDDVPLLCAREIPVPGAVGLCIRVLLHVHTERARSELEHVYLRGATVLRATAGLTGP